MKTILQKVGMTAVVGAALSVGNAAPIQLSTLIHGGSISIGDKVFSDFGFASSSFQASDATVEATVSSGGVYHLKFRGPFIAPAGTATDLMLQYSVATASGDPLISGIDQAFTMTSSGAGGVVLIGETVRRDSFGGAAVAQSTLVHVTGSPNLDDFEDPIAEPLTGDQLIIQPALAKVFVTKDVFILSLPGGTMGPTLLDQAFHQVSLPDTGATLSLLGLSLAGVAYFRRYCGPSELSR